MDAAAVPVAAVGSSGDERKHGRASDEDDLLGDTSSNHLGSCGMALVWLTCVGMSVGGGHVFRFSPFIISLFFVLFLRPYRGRDLSRGEERLRPCFRLPAAAHAFTLQHRHELTHDRIAVGLVLLFLNP
jgi:hypothetical protein